MTNTPVTNAQAPNTEAQDTKATNNTSAENTSKIAATRILLGVTLMALAMIVVPGMDGIAKYLSDNHSTSQIVWARYAFMTVLLLPFILLRYRREVLRPKSPAKQGLRGLLIIASNFLFFWSLAYMPIADALALLFVYPLAITIMSGLILKEKVGPRRYGAVVVGFLGVLIILRPEADNISIPALLAIAAGILHGAYIVLTRSLAQQTPALVTLFYTGIVGAVVMSAVAPFYWSAPTADSWFWMVILGLCSGLGHFLLTKACALAPASILAPLGYVEIISGTLIGYFIFGDFPDLLTWAGIIVICGSGLFIALREAQLKNRDH
ncbi:DMT family transporter [Kiloniella majae]|uniref:DMT family transporter n=1 Tax=Kiloniella majae TaxID=1938558 RepID=UPI000A27939B|nr:DMT family transporter [Kiloniella majae]